MSKSKQANRVILYTLNLRREVPIMGKDGQPTGEVKHFQETHKGCTYDQTLEIAKKATHVVDRMVEKQGEGVPGQIESSCDIAAPVNMQAPAGPRKPREASSAPKRFEMTEPTQHAPQPRETHRAGKSPAQDLVERKMREKAPGASTLADLVTVMAEEEVA